MSSNSPKESIQNIAETAPSPDNNRQFHGVSPIALLVAGAFFMEFLDGTVIATALPAMAVSFSVAAVDLNIGMTAYLLTLAALIPASGWIAERFGARMVFTLALAIFTIASLLCGFTRSMPQFVLMRVIQGIGGAMMLPVGRLTVLKNTPKPQLIKAIATITWPALVAPILGPPLGGFITHYASWHWIFFINVPLGIIGMLLAWKLIPVTNEVSEGEKRVPPFDRNGFFLTAAAMLLLVSGLELCSQQQVNWLNVALLLGVGALASVLALRHLRRAAAPMIRLEVMRIPTFRICMGGGFLFRITISSAPFLLPLLFQVGFGMDPFHSGLLVLAVFAGNLAMKPATTPLIRGLGFRKVLVGNGVISILSLLACVLLTPDTPTPLVMLILFVGGLSRSMQFTGVSTLAFADVPPEEMSYANTLFSTSLQLAVGLGITLGALGIRMGEFIAVHSNLNTITAFPFKFSFVLIALFALIGLIDICRLTTDAGESVSRKT